MALALALSITASPPPSRADVGQPDHDNASAAGLQLEAPLNEHESRCATAARVMQPKVTAAAEGAAAEGAAATAAMAAGSARPPLLLVLWASSQLNLKSRCRSFSGHFLRPLPRIWRCGPVYRPRP